MENSTSQNGKSSIKQGKSVSERVTSKSKYTYTAGEVLGNGSFGVVTQARCIETNETFAIKKVLQDPRYKNRELDIMKVLHHRNVIELKDFFCTERDGPKESEKYLNVVMEFIPDTVYRVMKSYLRCGQQLPLLLVKLYVYQMCRGLGYLHSLGYCHRDIKPQNLLVDTKTHTLKVCDFGSAKQLIPGEPSVAYICSRYYRAPELMLAATEYTTAIDIWSIGCVMGELLLGKPLFAGDTSVDQLVKIIQTKGTPTREEMFAMNQNYTEFKFPDVKPKSWEKVFGPSVPAEAIGFLQSLLKFSPADRPSAYDSLAHSYFDELRNPNTRLPGGEPMPPLFDFDEKELLQFDPHNLSRVVPPWYNNPALNKLSTEGGLAGRLHRSMAGENAHTVPPSHSKDPSLNNSRRQMDGKGHSASGISSSLPHSHTVNRQSEKNKPSDKEVSSNTSR